MRMQQAELKQNLGSGSNSSDDDFDDDDDDDEGSDQQNKKKGAKTLNPKKASAEKGQDAMKYFLKKAGKEVEESSEISMEEAEETEEIPVYENSGTSLGTGIVVKSQVKKSTSKDKEEDFDDGEDFEEEGQKLKKVKVKSKESPKSDAVSNADDDFEGSEVKKPPHQNIYLEQKVADKAKVIAPVYKKPAPVKASSPADVSEDSIANNFVEESIGDEMQASQQ